MLHRTPGRIQINTAVLPCLDLQRVNGVAAQQSKHSALLHPTNVAVAGAELPMLKATMPFAIAFDTFGLGTNVYTSVAIEGYIANVIAGVIDSSSTHVKYARQTDAKACGWIDSFRVQEGGICTAEVMLAFYAGDDDVDPLTRTGSQALPALSAIPEEHGIGVFTLNGAALDGVVGISYSSGLSFATQRTSGNKFFTGGIPSGTEPVLEIEIQDADAVESVLGSIGVKIASSTTISMLKYLNSALTATGARTITIANGYVAPQTASGAHGAHFKGGVRILGASANGSTHPFVVS